MNPNKTPPGDSASRQRRALDHRGVSRHPVLKAVIFFALLMGGYYLIEYRFLMHGRFLQPYLSLIAKATAGLLTLLGHETVAKGRWVASRSFQVEIVHGCDALEPTAAYLAALLASPVAFRAKLPGIFIGVIALWAVNMIRIVSLFLIGAHYPKALDVIHYDLWQAAFIVIAIAFWAFWVQWATRPKRVKPDAPT